MSTTVLGHNETLAEAAMLPNRSFNITCLLLQPMLDMFWCGLLSALLLQYWQDYGRRDRLWIKLNVLVAGVLAFGYSGYCIFIAVHFFVQNYGLYAPFYDYGLTSAFPALDASTAAVSQVYFTYRAWGLNFRHWAIAASMTLVIILYLCGAYTYTALVAHYWAQGGSGPPVSSTPGRIAVIGTMVANLFIMCLILLGLYRSRAAWKQSDKNMPFLRPVRMLLEAQVQLAVLSIIFAGVATDNPGSFGLYLLQGITSKLYAIGVLWSLYSRPYFSPPPLEPEVTSEWPSNQTDATDRLKVKVDVETAIHEDGHPTTLPYSINRTAEGDAGTASDPSYPSATSKSERDGSFTESLETPSDSSNSSPTSRRKPVPKDEPIVIMIAGAISQGVIYIGFYEAKVRGNVLAPIVVWTCASMGADLIITFSILWGLYRTRTGWHHNDKVIYRLIRMTLEAQVPPLLLTSAYTIIFIIYLAHQLSAYINNSKLNAIGLRDSLNSRAAFMHHDISMANPGGTDWRVSQMKSAGGASTTLAPQETRSAKLFGFVRRSAGGKSDPSKSTLAPSEHSKSPGDTNGGGDPLSPVASKAEPVPNLKDG
ncbi:uncharacterized protein LOC62_05G007016 [Vanrija pseudolonga]|uniref:DUF6534 domain-containing protein n=1 Tax=Vanrija pseudolonga TaxID=143232 RepID=A0AAF0YB66_9TREE|nr:hypothetical protein LOC62_05G007016 [Vanrija pseudolonga]